MRTARWKASSAALQSPFAIASCPRETNTRGETLLAWAATGSTGKSSTKHASKRRDRQGAVRPVSLRAGLPAGSRRDGSDLSLEDGPLRTAKLRRFRSRLAPLALDFRFPTVSICCIINNAVAYSTVSILALAASVVNSFSRPGSAWALGTIKGIRFRSKEQCATPYRTKSVSCCPLFILRPDANQPLFYESVKLDGYKKTVRPQRRLGCSLRSYPTCALRASANWAW